MECARDGIRTMVIQLLSLNVSFKKKLVLIIRGSSKCFMFCRESNDFITYVDSRNNFIIKEA